MFSSYQSRLSSASLAYSRLSAVSCVAVLAVVRVNQGDGAWELRIGHFGTEEDRGSFMGGRELAILCFFPLDDRVLGGLSVLYYYYLYMVCGETC